MGLTWITPDLLLTCDERALLAAAQRLGTSGDSVPLPAVADELAWPVTRARAAADLLTMRHDDRVDAGLGDGDEGVFVDA